MSRNCWDHRREPAAIRALQTWSAHEAHEVAIGLSFASESWNDWRVSTLTWLYAQDDANFEVIATRLAYAVVAAAGNAGIAVTPNVVAVAVKDAMTLIRHRKTVSLSQRAMDLRMRKQSFTILRNQAERSLRAALEWAMIRFLSTTGIKISQETPDAGHQRYARAA